jgi:hypothetical protein
VSTRCKELACNGKTDTEKEVWCSGNEGWRTGDNELQKLIREEVIVKYAQAQRIKWRGQLNRMEEIKRERKITEWYPRVIR